MPTKVTAASMTTVIWSTRKPTRSVKSICGMCTQSKPDVLLTSSAPEAGSWSNRSTATEMKPKNATIDGDDRDEVALARQV